MLKMFMEAREMAKILKSKEGGEDGVVGAVTLHWDLLQVHTGSKTRTAQDSLI